MSRSREDQKLSWERFRFAIVGPLLASPPEPGQLRTELRALAAKQWRHPLDATRRLTVSFSTLERWYYKAVSSRNPVQSLKRRLREDAGRYRSMSAAVELALKEQYQHYKHWSVQLHYDNLKATAEKDPRMTLPSYSTVRRFMKSQGWNVVPKPKRSTEGAIQAQRRLEEREVRSFEVDHVNALWHLDFHHGSIKLLSKSGEWKTPKLLGIIDDCSRLICHLQWYWEEDTETLVHGFTQALQKRGLPRALMTDNGSAMTSDEFTLGLHALGILHETTLPYSPYQNGKQESLWTSIEGRLLAMLCDLPNLTLEMLNDYSQIWTEREYHRSIHRELRQTPLSVFLKGKSVARECPNTKVLERAFRRQTSRKQRRSDGTISLDGKRYEIPNAYRHIELITVRYAHWDMSTLEMIDTQTDQPVAALYPLDKSANANNFRRTIHNDAPAIIGGATKPTPPLLDKMMTEHKDAGTPIAYFPKKERSEI